MIDLITKTKKYFPGKPDYVTKINIKYKRKIDKFLLNKIYKFIKQSFRNSSLSVLNHVIVGLSGGLDSTVVALLCKNALGKDHVTAVIVDLGLKEHREQTRFAVSIAKKLDINYVVVKAPDLYKSYQYAIRENGPFTEINITTRLIHNLIFQYADAKMAVVASTVDKSEYITGRHMEYFYGHFAPMFGLYKTEIYDLAKYLKIPKEVISREPGCFDAWFDKDIFGVSYDILDPIIYLIYEKGLTANNISKKYKIDEKWLRKIEFRIKNHKYRMQTEQFKI